MRNLVTPLVLCVALALPSALARPARAAKHPTNACGCYGEANACFCEKKAKCGCPGECEPKGCEEERAKKLQKEIDEETRKAKEEEKAQIEKAQTKAKEEAKPVKNEDDDEADTATTEKEPAKGAHAGKSAPVRKMTSAQKKQLQKLIDAYLAEHPDGGKKSLSDVRGGL